jgi:uncharacterized membrane protein YfcA
VVWPSKDRADNQGNPRPKRATRLFREWAGPIVLGGVFGVIVGRLIEHGDWIGLVVVWVVCVVLLRFYIRFRARRRPSRSPAD